MKKILWISIVAVGLAACGGTESSLFSKAQRLTQKGNFSKAIQLYSQIIKNNPNSTAAYASRGLLYERLKAKDAAELKKNKQLAEKDYVKAIELNYKQPELYNNLAALYLDTGNYNEALLYLNQAIYMRPNYVMALLNRAVAYSKLGKIGNALLDFSQVEQLNPNFSLLYLNRGLAEYAAGYYASAAEDYATLMELEPQNPRPYLERGRTFVKMGYLQNALDDFQTAMALNPKYAMPYYYAAELLFSRGDTEQAISYAQQAKMLASNYAPIYDMLGDMLALESPVEATQHYLAARRLDPAHANRYQTKIRMMTTEEGRKRVVGYRFLNVGKKK